MSDKVERGRFGTRFGFVMAAAGSAVGLGNLWKFPYITGEYGGGAFVLVYLVCIALVGLPLMYAELILGRRGGSSVVGALAKLTRGRGGVASDLAGVTGIMAVASGFLILSFYSVVAGWGIHFLFVSLGLIPHAAEGTAATFGEIAGNPLLSGVWHTVFMLLTIGVIASGVRDGIERVTKRLMPALIGILVALLVYVMFTGGLPQALYFLFVPDFSKLTGDAVLEALGHAFFTLSLGMGAMITYGSYLPGDSHVVRDGLVIAIIDTIVALLAGMVLFSVVFHGGMEPQAGPGLVFVTLPTLFAGMPGGQFVATAFFVLLIFAAWSSAISLLEVVVAWLVDEKGMARPTATWTVGGLIWAVGLTAAYWPVVIDFLDNLTTMYMLPLGGLCIALAAGWFVSRRDAEAGFDGVPGGPILAVVWRWTIRVVTPALIVIVILGKMGVFRTAQPDAAEPDEAAAAEP